MNSILIFILSIVAFYYIFKFSMRLLLPYFMKKLAEKMVKNADKTQYSYTNMNGNPFGQSNPFTNRYQDNARKTENSVKVDYNPQLEDKRKGTSTAGEFVDFEEIK